MSETVLRRHHRVFVGDGTEYGKLTCLPSRIVTRLVAAESVPRPLEAWTIKAIRVEPEPTDDTAWLRVTDGLIHVSSSGIVVASDDGVFVRRVAGGFGGYEWSFAKGRVEAGLSLEQNALKELQEEMGLEARIVRVLGDYKGDTGVTRFYVGEVSGGDRRAHGPETAEVRLVSREEAQTLLNRQRDRRVLDDLYRP